MARRFMFLVCLCTLAGCPRGSSERDSSLPPADAPPTFEYDAALGQPFDQAIALNDARVEAIDPSDLPVANAPCRQPVLARVTSVVDGDTFWVSGVSEQLSAKVRVIGVDTPERAFNDKPAECFSQESTAFTQLLEGHMVWLTFDAECVDDTPSKRTLSYVWTGVGPQDSWERQLLRRGFAKAFPFGDNRSFANQFANDESFAQQAGAGLWGACR